MTKRILTLLCCCTLAACGGDDDDVNAATARDFSYAPRLAAPPPESVTDAISSMRSFQGLGDESSAVAVQGSLMQVGFEVLGDDLGIGGFAVRSESATALVREARSRTFAAALGNAATQFDPACVVVDNRTAGTTIVTFANCTVSESTADGNMTVKATGKVVGQLGAVAWDVKYSLSMAGPEAAITLAYHDLGRMDFAANFARAHQEANIGASIASGGKRVEIGLAQSVDLDLALDSACATNVTGGTLEAKRVWTKQPSGANEVDGGVLFTWTGCGVANVQYSR
jgi:hypothetical protein